MSTTKESRAELALGETLAREAGPAGPAAAAAAALPTGSDRYQRRRELGRGGMGRVHEALDQQFNRSVAIKEMSIEDPSASMVRRFTTEAIVTGHLEHPGIPSVYERGVDANGRPFYAMRRVQGRTLTRLLGEADSRERRLALLPIVIRVAQTIGFAHDHGVVHRDIKPDNILVGDHGETFVLDWGLARVRGVPIEELGGSSPGEGGGTMFGTVVGTPAYMAPEQASGEVDRIDERTDVFALGALLYHLLSGTAPYRGASADDVIDAARARRLAPVAQVAPGTPDELAAICARATAREPDERYRNANELAVALEQFSARSVLGRPARLISLLAEVGTVVAVLGVALGMVFLMREASGLRHHGWAANATMVLGDFGCVVSVVEWLTRGRYRLGSLGLGVAVTTFFGSIASAAAALGQLHGTLAGDPALLADPAAYNHAASIGLWEVLGGLGIGAELAGFQMMLWAAARRRVQRAAG